MEHRRALRRSVAAEEPLGHARLRTGGQLRVLDASSWGALMETTERLLPGRHLDVHIVSAEGRMLVRSRVARAFVARVAPDAVHYRVAFSFDRAVDVRAAGYALPSPLLAPKTERGTPYPDRPSSHDIEFADAPSAEETPAKAVVASRLV
jgi:hypothetical protein